MQTYSVNYTRAQNQTPFCSKITILDGIVGNKTGKVSDIIQNVADIILLKGESVSVKMIEGEQGVIEHTPQHLSSKHNGEAMKNIAQEIQELGFHIKYEA
jgi:hypothetical protein